MAKQLSTLFLSLVIALTFITYALACSCCGNQSTSNTSVQQTLQGEEVGEKVQCPVMKNWVLPSEAADSTEYDGKTYYFCCGGCKEKFLAEPEKYISDL